MHASAIGLAGRMAHFLSNGAMAGCLQRNAAINGENFIKIHP